MRADRRRVGAVGRAAGSQVRCATLWTPPSPHASARLQPCHRLRVVFPWWQPWGPSTCAWHACVACPAHWPYGTCLGISRGRPIVCIARPSASGAACGAVLEQRMGESSASTSEVHRGPASHGEAVQAARPDSAAHMRAPVCRWTLRRGGLRRPASQAIVQRRRMWFVASSGRGEAAARCRAISWPPSLRRRRPRCVCLLLPVRDPLLHLLRCLSTHADMP